MFHLCIIKNVIVVVAAVRRSGSVLIAGNQTIQIQSRDRRQSCDNKLTHLEGSLAELPGLSRTMV